MAAKQAMIRIATFGVNDKARYSMLDRSHAGYKNTDKLTPVELLNAIRGEAIATLMAMENVRERLPVDDADIMDAKIALVNIQRTAAELGRRLMRYGRSGDGGPATEIVEVEDARELGTNLLAMLNLSDE